MRPTIRVPIIWVCVALTFLCLTVEVARCAEIALEEDITYGKAGDTELKLDLARPQGDGPFPAIVFIHGGGWYQGNRQGYRGQIQEAAKKGYVAATISYRLMKFDETREAKVWLWPEVGRPANAKPEHAPEGWKWFHADDQDVWNDVRIVCQGTRIKTIMNGVTIAECDGAGRLDDEGHLSHNVGLKGHIGLQIHPGRELLIRFRDIEVRELE